MLRARNSELDYQMQAKWLMGESYRAARSGVDTGMLGSDEREGFHIRLYYMLRRWFRRAGPNSRKRRQRVKDIMHRGY